MQKPSPQTYLRLALIVAWVATLGSLFFSEVLRFTPCLLCWYQRIVMYPLAVILAVATLRRDAGVAVYVLPLSLTGLLVSGYHYLLQKTTFLPVPTLCTASVPCETSEMNLLGFVTIPLLSFTAFAIITVLMLILRRGRGITSP